jgi:hypothetical protein
MTIRNKRMQDVRGGRLVVTANAVFLAVFLTGVIVRVVLGNMLTSTKYQTSILQKNLATVGTSGTSDTDDIDMGTLMAMAKKSGMIENTKPLILHLDSGVAYVSQGSAVR